MLSTEGQSLLVKKGALSDLDLALVLTVNVLPNIVNVESRFATKVLESVSNVVIGDCFWYPTDLDVG